VEQGPIQICLRSGHLTYHECLREETCIYLQSTRHAHICTRSGKVYTRLSEAPDKTFFTHGHTRNQSHWSDNDEGEEEEHDDEGGGGEKEDQLSMELPIPKTNKRQLKLQAVMFNQEERHARPKRKRKHARFEKLRESMTTYQATQVFQLNSFLLDQLRQRMLKLADEYLLQVVGNAPQTIRSDIGLASCYYYLEFRCRKPDFDYNKYRFTHHVLALLYCSRRESNVNKKLPSWGAELENLIPNENDLPTRGVIRRTRTLTDACTLFIQLLSQCPTKWPTYPENNYNKHGMIHWERPGILEWCDSFFEQHGKL